MGSLSSAESVAIMASLNKVILIGNLGGDPETRYTTAGDAVASISLATTDEWRDKGSGEKRQQTEWHKVVFFKKLAEIVGQHLRKGSQVYVEGRVKTKKWTDKDGIERYMTQVEATEMKMLSKRKCDDSQAPQGGTVADLDDDIPF